MPSVQEMAEHILTQTSINYLFRVVNAEEFTFVVEIDVCEADGETEQIVAYLQSLDKQKRRFSSMDTLVEALRALYAETMKCAAEAIDRIRQFVIERSKDILPGIDADSALPTTFNTSPTGLRLLLAANTSTSAITIIQNLLFNNEQFDSVQSLVGAVELGFSKIIDDIAFFLRLPRCKLARLPTLQSSGHGNVNNPLCLPITSDDAIWIYHHGMAGAASLSILYSLNLSGESYAVDAVLTQSRTTQRSVTRKIIQKLALAVACSYKARAEENYIARLSIIERLGMRSGGNQSPLLRTPCERLSDAEVDNFFSFQVPEREILGHLDDFEAVGYTFNDYDALATAIFLAHQSLRFLKSQTLEYLLEDQRSLLSATVKRSSIICDVDHLFKKSGAGRDMTSYLNQLEQDKEMFSSWDGLIEAVIRLHRQAVAEFRQDGQKVLEYLSDPRCDVWQNSGEVKTSAFLQDADIEIFFAAIGRTQRTVHFRKDNPSGVSAEEFLEPSPKDTHIMRNPLELLFYYFDCVVQERKRFETSREGILELGRRIRSLHSEAIRYYVSRFACIPEELT